MRFLDLLPNIRLLFLPSSRMSLFPLLSQFLPWPPWLVPHCTPDSLLRLYFHAGPIPPHFVGSSGSSALPCVALADLASSAPSPILLAESRTNASLAMVTTHHTFLHDADDRTASATPPHVFLPAACADLASRTRHHAILHASGAVRASAPRRRATLHVADADRASAPRRHATLHVVEQP
ncbi:unnamed protein product [Closterium sp. NIES-53]